MYLMHYENFPALRARKLLAPQVSLKPLHSPALVLVLRKCLLKRKLGDGMGYSRFNI